jgi:hypothetical protein
LSNLVGASVDLVIAAGLASLNSLRLNEHSLALLLVLSVMLMKNKVLMGLDHLDAGLLKRFSDEHLEDGLDLEVEVEQAEPSTTTNLLHEDLGEPGRWMISDSFIWPVLLAMPRWSGCSSTAASVM